MSGRGGAGTGVAGSAGDGVSTPAGVVLAAGAGTRLRPLTTLRPKALCPVDNVPLLDRALDLVRPHVDEVAVNAHHLSDQIVAHVGTRAHLSVECPEALGTAGALGAMLGWIDGRDVLLINADAYLPDGIAALVAGWDGSRCRLLVAPTSDTPDFTDASDGVRYVGACLLPWRLVSALPATPGGLYEALWRHELASGRLELVRHRGTAIDCGTPADYLRANLHASRGASVVGDGAVVEGVVDRCVVWPRAFVGPGERLADCIRAGTRSEPMTVPAATADRARTGRGSDVA